MDIRPVRPAMEGSLRGLFWSPKADRLFVVSWNSETKASCLSALDMKVKTQLWSVTTDLTGGWCMTPDGKSVVLITQAKGEKAPAVARRFDAASGKEVATRKCRSCVAFTIST